MYSGYHHGSIREFEAYQGDPWAFHAFGMSGTPASGTGMSGFTDIYTKAEYIAFSMRAGFSYSEALKMAAEKESIEGKAFKSVSAGAWTTTVQTTSDVDVLAAITKATAGSVVTAAEAAKSVSTTEEAWDWKGFFTGITSAAGKIAPAYIQQQTTAKQLEEQTKQMQIKQEMAKKQAGIMLSQGLLPTQQKAAMPMWVPLAAIGALGAVILARVI